MLQPIYCIKDNKSGFMTPTVDQNDATAMRGFEHALMNAGTILGTHPADFDLYKIAVFNTESGRIEPLDQPEFILGGYVVESELAKRKKGKNRV